MSAAIDTAIVKKALERAGADWIFRYWGGDEAKHLGRVRSDIEKFRREYRRRFRETPDPYALLDDNPVKGAAFFQIDTLQSSLEMKVMIWRILLGCEIVGLDYHYEQGTTPNFTVRIRAPYSDEVETYVAQSPGDFRVLRHFGFVQTDDQLFFQGYFAVRDK